MAVKNVLKQKNGRRSDFEKETQGVKGRSTVFSLIPNQPLTSPVDVMHQLLLGVAKELLLFYYERLRHDKKVELDLFLSRNEAPKEFTRKICPLKDIATFKAKEFKVHLLYLAPIVFPQYFFGEDRISDTEDLNKLIYALRSLYESCDEAAQCEFRLSMNEKYNQFESINFHLLRHLAWQAQNIGPLFATSASMFEAANHRVICPLTGTTNHCDLLVTRYVRNKILGILKINEDCLSSCLDSSRGRKFNDTFSLKKNTESQSFEAENPSCRIFGRLFTDFYLTSTVYTKSKRADKFVCIVLDETVVGEIDFFYEIDNSKGLCLKIFNIIRRLRLVNHQNTIARSVFGYIVEETEKFIRVPVSSITSKLIPVFFQETLHLVKLMKHFEHE